MFLRFLRLSLFCIVIGFVGCFMSECCGCCSLFGNILFERRVGLGENFHEVYLCEWCDI